MTLNSTNLLPLHSTLQSVYHCTQSITFNTHTDSTEKKITQHQLYSCDVHPVMHPCAHLHFCFDPSPSWFSMCKLYVGATTKPIHHPLTTLPFPNPVMREQKHVSSPELSLHVSICGEGGRRGFSRTEGINTAIFIQLQLCRMVMAWWGMPRIVGGRLDFSIRRTELSHDEVVFALCFDFFVHKRERFALFRRTSELVRGATLSPWGGDDRSRRTDLRPCHVTSSVAREEKGCVLA